MILWIEPLGRKVYRWLIDVLPTRASRALQRRVSNLRLKQDVPLRPKQNVRRPANPLVLPGSGSVRIIDLLGVDTDNFGRALVWAQQQASPQRNILVVSSPDFRKLVAAQLSFEYIPAAPDVPEWARSQVDPETIDERLAVIARCYGATGGIDRSFTMPTRRFPEETSAADD